MNKKISTLLASFLLAGGLFSTANAIDLRTATPGQYYKLVGTAHYDGSQWNDRTKAYYVVNDEGTIKVSKVADDENAYWTIETRGIQSGKDVRFVNVATGRPLTLTVGDESSEWFNVQWFAQTSGIGTSGALTIGDANQILWNENQYHMTIVQNGSEWLISSSEATTPYPFAIDAVLVPATVYNATNNNIDALADDNGNGETFNLSIGAQVWNKDESKWEGFESYNPLNGNVFTGDLKAKVVDGEMRLLNSDGKYIVLIDQKWGGFDGEAVTGAMSYKFALATDKNITDKKVGDYNILASDFCIAKPATSTGAPVEVVALGSSEYGTANEEYELRVAVVDEDNAYLTVAADKNDETADYTVGNNNNGKPADNTYVRFGADNNVDYAIFYDKVLNITREKDDVVEAAAPACNKEFVPVAQVALGQPEGMWIWDGFNFINRESGNTISIKGLRTTDEANVYTDGTYNYTIVAVGVPGDYKFNGYFGGEYNAEQLKVKSFRIGSPLASAKDTVYMALGDDDQIAWTTDAMEAIEFRFTRVETDDLDLVKHFTTYNGLDKDGNIVEKTDTLNFYRYTIKDVTGKKELYWDNTNGRYMLSDGTNASYRSNIVLKAKDNNCYNILRVNGNQAYASKDAADNDYLTFADNFCNNWYKVYGAHNENEVGGRYR